MKVITGWVWFFALLVCAGTCNRSSEEAPPKPSVVAQVSPAQKQLCLEAKQTAATAWTQYATSAAALSDAATESIAKVQSSLDDEKKANYDHNDEYWRNHHATAMTVRTKYLALVTTAAPAYKSAANTATASAKLIALTTRDARPASDKALADARKARDAALQIVNVSFEPGADGMGDAVALAKMAAKYGQTIEAADFLKKMQAHMDAMLDQQTKRHTSVFAIAEKASAASDMIEDVCKGLP